MKQVRRWCYGEIFSASNAMKFYYQMFFSTQIIYYLSYQLVWLTYDLSNYVQKSHNISYTIGEVFQFYTMRNINVRRTMFFKNTYSIIVLQVRKRVKNYFRANRILSFFNINNRHYQLSLKYQQIQGVFLATENSTLSTYPNRISQLYMVFRFLNSLYKHGQQYSDPYFVTSTTFCPFSYFLTTCLYTPTMFRIYTDLEGYQQHSRSFIKKGSGGVDMQSISFCVYTGFSFRICYNGQAQGVQRMEVSVGVVMKWDSLNLWFVYFVCSFNFVQTQFYHHQQTNLMRFYEIQNLKFYLLNKAIRFCHFIIFYDLIFTFCHFEFFIFYTTFPTHKVITSLNFPLSLALLNITSRPQHQCHKMYFSLHQHSIFFEFRQVLNTKSLLLLQQYKIMNFAKQQAVSFWDFGPHQIAAALGTALAVAPFNAIGDRAVIENANGKTPLWTGVANGFRRMFLKPNIFFFSYEYKWLLFVYHVTYTASNLADHYKLPFVDPVLSKLLTVFLFNTSTGIIKDKCLAQYFGQCEVRPFPWKSLGLFFFRDFLAMASAFTLPPILGKKIEEKMNVSADNALRIAQISTPVLTQIVATPFHLLGLSLYNRPQLSMGQRFTQIKKICFETTVLRMLRFLPAFGIGGVINIELRKYLVNKKH